MRKWASVVAVLAALTASGTAEADTPPDVYSDYAEDGVLSCGHSRAALKGVLNDAGIHQYGDPLTFLGLKLAVRQQLAGGCRREQRAVLPIGSASGGEGPPTASGGDTDASAGAKERSGSSKPVRPSEDPSTSSGEDRAEALPEGALSSGQDGWMLLLGVMLLLLTLGSGGWAARRVFND